ncbi:hypothetical protein EBBID32_38980 [Sphingobium indicum BiD32]|uniref:Uncharacterized protein n=1 Tax=Sphingobium indicum BiD32 TaxID=1301087 RepID=N1MRF3_9SPHN|nr:hypothetical protein EBBID32_38980 [Sphingobium indicum BiD32]
MGKGRIGKTIKFLAAPAKMTTLPGFSPAAPQGHGCRARAKPLFRSRQTIRIVQKPI